MFNPQEYITKIKGKDYLEVKWRLVWFRDEHPIKDFDNSIRLKTTIVEDSGDQANVRAELYSPTGELLATAHKREHKKEFHDYMEKAETGAIGRVLAMAGYGTQFAEELEMPQGKVVDAPVESKSRTTTSKTTDTRTSNKEATNTDTPATNSGPSSADEKEKRRQDAIARAQAKNNSGASNSQKVDDKKEEVETKTETKETANPITDGQKKAIENLVKIVTRKKEFDLSVAIKDTFDKGDIDELTQVEGIALIKVLNGEMKN